MIVCRNIQNNDLYKYISDTEWQNIRTGQIGVVPPETAQKIFLINTEATYLCIEYGEQFCNLIKTLNLKIDKNGNE